MRRRDNIRIEDFEVAEQIADLVGIAPPATPEGGLQLLLGRTGLRIATGAEVCDEYITAGRNLVIPEPHHGGRILVVVEVVQDRAEDDADGLLEIDQSCDVRDPASIRDHPDVARLIDFEQPVGVIFSSILHHLNDDEDPATVVRFWNDQISSGSYVFITHFRSGRNPETSAAEQKLQSTFGRGRWRDTDEIRDLFGDLEVLDPNIVPSAHWRPDVPESDTAAVGAVGRELTVWEQLIVTGLARKP